MVIGKSGQEIYLPRGFNCFSANINLPFVAASDLQHTHTNGIKKLDSHQGRGLNTLLYSTKFRIHEATRSLKNKTLVCAVEGEIIARLGNNFRWMRFTAINNCRASIYASVVSSSPQNIIIEGNECGGDNGANC
jgi:hypothetical protein